MTRALHSTCPTEGKRGYPSKRAARQAHRDSGDRLRYYRCQACSDWHATGVSVVKILNKPTRGRGKGARPRATPKDPQLHNFLSLPGDPSLCFVCGQSEEAHEA